MLYRTVIAFVAAGSVNSTYCPGARLTALRPDASAASEYAVRSATDRRPVGHRVLGLLLEERHVGAPPRDERGIEGGAGHDRRGAAGWPRMPGGDGHDARVARASDGEAADEPRAREEGTCHR